MVASNLLDHIDYVPDGFLIIPTQIGKEDASGPDVKCVYDGTKLESCNSQRTSATPSPPPPPPLPPTSSPNDHGLSLRRKSTLHNLQLKNIVAVEVPPCAADINIVQTNLFTGFRNIF